MGSFIEFHPFDKKIVDYYMQLCKKTNGVLSRDCIAFISVIRMLPIKMKAYGLYSRVI